MLAGNQQLSSYRTARAVIDLAEQHGVEPSPPIYELLTAHLERRNPALSEGVSKALDRSAQERERYLKEIYETHFRGPDVGEGLERIRSGLASELNEVASSIAKGVDGNLRLASELRRSLRDLAGMVTREELQLLCRHLVYSGREQLSDTQHLADRLERTQFQLTEMRQELSDLRERNTKDPLTGLNTNGRFNDSLEACVWARRPFCLSLIELDGMQELQSVWGLSVRDNILRGMGHLLRRHLKGQDIAARIGPYSFGIILPDTPLDGAKSLLESLRLRFAKITWVSQSTDVEIGQQTLSIGLTEWSPDVGSVVTLRNRATAQLEAAQVAGGNRVSVKE